MLLVILYRDIMRYKPLYMNNYNMLVLLGLMIIRTIITAGSPIMCFSTSRKGSFSCVEDAVYGIPIAAGAMFVTLLFDFHTAIIFSFTISFLSGLWLNDPLYPVYTFAGSLTAAFSVIRCKKRSALL